MLQLAYYIELTWLLVDTMSGFLQNNSILLPGGQTISAMFRVLTLPLFLLIIVSYPKIKRLPVLAMLLLSVIWVIVHMIGASQGSERVITDLQFHMKLMTVLLLAAVLQIQIEQRSLTDIKLRRIIFVNATVLLVNLFLGLLGIGFSNYGEAGAGDALGSKGFFYAGNEVSATLVAIFALIVFSNRDIFRKNAALLLTVVGVFFIASLLSLSKTSLLGFMLVLIFVIYNYLSRSNKIKFFAILAALTVASIPYWMPLLQVSIERWEYFWEISPDFWVFITSGRIERIDEYANWLRDANSIWSLIFGNGQISNELASPFENDLLDLTYTSGILGLFFYGVWGSWLIRGIRDSWHQHRSAGTFTAYMMSMFLMLSIIAGHVMYSAMLAPFLAMLSLTSVPNFQGVYKGPVRSALA